MCFSAAASSENDHGSMNFASNTAPVPSTMPSSVAAIQRITGWRTQLWTSLTTCPVVRSYHCRFRGSVASPKLDDEIARRSSGFRLAPLFPPEAEKGGLVVAHDDPGVRAADKGSAADIFGVNRRGGEREGHDTLQFSCTRISAAALRITPSASNCWNRWSRVAAIEGTTRNILRRLCDDRGGNRDDPLQMAGAVFEGLAIGVVMDQVRHVGGKGGDQSGVRRRTGFVDFDGRPRDMSSRIAVLMRSAWAMGVSVAWVRAGGEVPACLGSLLRSTNLCLSQFP